MVLIGRITKDASIKKLKDEREVVNFSIAWNISAENLISLMLRYTIFYAPVQYQNLYNVLKLLDEFTGSPKNVDRLFVATKDDELLAMYKAVVALDSKMLLSITSTASAALSIFADPQIAEITGTDTIDFESFRRSKTILYINNSVNSMKYYTAITSIFFEQFFASIMQELPGKDDKSVFFLLDEASSLYLSILPVAISNIRKYAAGLFQIYQSQNQLLDLYGVQQGRNIIANSYAKVYMFGQPLETARELELILGKYEYMDAENNRRTRQLLTMDEIRILKEAIILCGNLPPIKAKLVPFYEQRELNRLANIPACTLEQKYYEEDLEEINLNQYDKPKA